MKSDPSGDLSLERLAAEAGFSRFHFHRIFRSLTGLTLNEAVTRARLDRARQLMAQQPDLTLTDVALRCGFGSSSNFSRTFRGRFGVPPSVFDHAAYHRSTKTERASWFQTPIEPPDQQSFEVEVSQLPKRTVAYLRVTQPYVEGRVAEAATQLSTLVSAHQLQPRRWLGFTWDHPDFVPAEQCDYNLGVELPVDHGTIPPPLSRFDASAMTVAAIALSGPSTDAVVQQEVEAIDWLYTTWLPASGYEPTNDPTTEVWEHEPGPNDTSLTVQLPIQRSR